MAFIGLSDHSSAKAEVASEMPEQCSGRVLTRRESLKSLETFEIYKNCLVNFFVLRVAAGVDEKT